MALPRRASGSERVSSEATNPSCRQHAEHVGEVRRSLSQYQVTLPPLDYRRLPVDMIQICIPTITKRLIEIFMWSHTEQEQS